MSIQEGVLIGLAILAPVTLVTIAVLVLLVRRGTAWRRDESSYNHLTKVGTSYFASTVYVYLLVVCLVVLILINVR